MGRDRADHHRRTHFARNRGLGLRLWLRGHNWPTYKPWQFRIDSRSRLCLPPSLRQIPAQEQVFLLRSGDLQCDRPVVAAPLRVRVALSRLSKSGWSVLPQSEWEEQGARISYNLERGFSHVQENSESLQRPGEGRHTSAPSPRTHPGVGSVRPARHSPHDVLPLAEGVLRERRCRIRAPLPPPQRRQGPEDRPAGTKAATQARSPLRTHGGTYP